MQTQEFQNSIKLLPEHLIDQIKAGEVVERPSGLVKELLENAIDAGSTKIDIHFKENGLEYISIKDNGKGMNFQELPFAFCRHATSKIESFSDLYSLSSYGFRGEALASIASIGRVQCLSTPSTGEEGGQINIEGGQVLSHDPYNGGVHGTEMIVRDLFFNTPVRLKFVKSKTAEKNALTKTVNAFFLSYPNIQFSIKWDNDDKKIYTPVNNSFERFLQMHPRTSREQMLPVHGEYDGYFLEGLVNCDGKKAGVGKHQYLFVNKRYINDKKLHQAIINQCRAIWGFDKQGGYLMEINLPANHVDVNVHPNKVVVKFADEGRVFSLVSATLKKTIADHNVGPEFETKEIDHTPKYQEAVDITVEDHNTDHFFTRKFNTNVENDYKLRKVTNEFYLYQDNDIVYLLSIRNLIGGLLTSFSEEDEITPLLISIPYQWNIDDDDLLAPLNRLGIEFDRINGTSLLLRTIPSSINELNYREIIGELLDLLKSENTIVGYEPSSKVLDNISPYWVEKNIVSMEESFWIRELNNETLNQLFSQS